MRTRNYRRRDPAHVSLYNRSAAASRCISDHNNRRQNKPRKRRSDGVAALGQASARAGGGGGGGGYGTCGPSGKRRVAPVRTRAVTICGGPGTWSRGVEWFGGRAEGCRGTSRSMSEHTQQLRRAPEKCIWGGGWGGLEPLPPPLEGGVQGPALHFPCFSCISHDKTAGTVTVCPCPCHRVTPKGGGGGGSSCGSPLGRRVFTSGGGGGGRAPKKNGGFGKRAQLTGTINQLL